MLLCILIVCQDCNIRRFLPFKNYDIETLVDYIDNCDDKDIIYEMFGLTTPKKKKISVKKKEPETKIEKSKENNFLSLMSNFKITGDFNYESK